jgi:hypothetical protein
VFELLGRFLDLGLVDVVVGVVDGIWILVLVVLNVYPFLFIVVLEDADLERRANRSARRSCERRSRLFISSVAQRQSASCSAF